LLQGPIFVEAPIASNVIRCAVAAQEETAVENKSTTQGYSAPAVGMMSNSSTVLSGVSFRASTNARATVAG